VLAKILKPALSWDKAKEIFSAEYSKADTKLRNRTKLIALRQGNRSAASYLREVEQLAPSSDQNLDDAFFINFILTERLPKSIRRQIHMRLKPEELMTLSFDRLKSEAIFIEECEASTPTRRTYTQEPSSQEPSTTKTCNWKGCTSTEHSFYECPKRQLTCDDSKGGCGRTGHLVKDCRDTKGGTVKPRTPNAAPDVTCFKCGEKGHYADKCQTTQVKTETKEEDKKHLRLTKNSEDQEYTDLRRDMYDDDEANAVIDFFRVR
jgi:hypothetical protein